MGGSWKDNPTLPWWRTIGRCGRCRAFHLFSWFMRNCPDCGSGKV